MAVVVGDGTFRIGHTGVANLDRVPVKNLVKNGCFWEMLID